MGCEFGSKSGTSHRNSNGIINLAVGPLHVTVCPVMKNVAVLLLAGGEGVRFQPISTPEKPKQFLNLTHTEQSMLQQTWERALRLADPQNIWIATNQKYVSLVQKQIPEVVKNQVIGETQKKNTAPAIALITWILANKNPDTILVVLPSDHFIDEPDLFERTVRKALDAAQEHGGILTLGIPPREASTQYGYIKCGKAVIEGEDLCQVQCFTEKPVRHRAEKFISEGGYYWNSGMFIFSVQKMKEEITRHVPVIAELLGELKKDSPSLSFVEKFFEEAPSISIDYAVMENTERAMVIPAPFFWSDVGSWEGLLDLTKKRSLVLPPNIKEAIDHFSEEKTS